MGPWYATMGKRLQSRRGTYSNAALGASSRGHSLNNGATRPTAHPTQSGYFEAAASCSFYDQSLFLFGKRLCMSDAGTDPLAGE
jgi:hypothetical protein